MRAEPARRLEWTSPVGFRMPDLTTLRNEFDDEHRTCRVIIETPKGSRNKYAYDVETGLFSLGGLLPEGLVFPFDFGFVPSTLGDDGDPVDIMVLMDAPTHVGCLVDVRVIGVIAAAGPKRAIKALKTGIRAYEKEKQP